MLKPVIIIGAPRSGTTILGDVLSAHPDFHYMIEPNLFWRRFVRKQSDLLLAPQNQDIVELTRNQFEKALCSSGKKRLLEKTPQNCLRFPFVHSVFPDAKFIHIIRNGEESALSINKFWQTNTSGFEGVRLGQRLKEISLRQVPHYAGQFVKRLIPSNGKPRVFWGPVLPGMSGLVNELSTLEVAALQWRNCVELACHYGRSLSSDQYLEIRLEDLNEDSFRQIAEFISISDSDSVIERFRAKFESGQTQHRKSEASEEDLRLLRPWLESTMAWLGQLPS